MDSPCQASQCLIDRSIDRLIDWFLIFDSMISDRRLMVDLVKRGEKFDWIFDFLNSLAAKLLKFSDCNQSVNQSIDRSLGWHQPLTCPWMRSVGWLIDWLVGNKNRHNSVSFDFSGRKLFLLYSGRRKQHSDIEIFKMEGVKITNQSSNRPNDQTNQISTARKSNWTSDKHRGNCTAHRTCAHHFPVRFGRPWLEENVRGKIKREIHWHHVHIQQVSSTGVGGIKAHGRVQCSVSSHFSTICTVSV